MEPYLSGMCETQESCIKSHKANLIIPNDKMTSAEIDPYLRDVKKVDCTQANLHARQYAAGLTDADGCFKIIGRKNFSLQFAIEQAIKGMGALEYLYDNFGGSINLQLAGDEKNQRAYVWVLNGEDASQYVACIIDFLLLKKREAMRFLQFPVQNLHVIPIIATNALNGETLVFDTLKACKTHFGVNLAFQKRDKICSGHWVITKSLSKKEVEDIRTKRSEIGTDLRRMKTELHEDIPLNYTPHVAYLAGFFDGDGCIDAIGKSGQHHSINQKSVAICDLYKRIFGGSVSRGTKGIYHWDIYDGADDFLSMISPFVKGKQRQAHLILHMKAGESEITHAKLRCLKGKGIMKTPRIDRLTAGSTTFTAVKDLPKGVFRFSHDPTLIFVQIQHQKKVYRLQHFKIGELDQAVALYKATKRNIRMNKEYKITEYRGIVEKKGKGKAKDTIAI